MSPRKNNLHALKISDFSKYFSTNSMSKEEDVQRPHRVVQTSGVDIPAGLDAVLGMKAQQLVKTSIFSSNLAIINRVRCLHAVV